MENQHDNKLRNARHIIFAVAELHRRGLLNVRVAPFWGNGVWCAAIGDQSLFSGKLGIAISEINRTKADLYWSGMRHWLTGVRDCDPCHMADEYMRRYSGLWPALESETEDYANWFKGLVTFLAARPSSVPVVTHAQEVDAVWVHFLNPTMEEHIGQPQLFQEFPASLEQACRGNHPLAEFRPTDAPSLLWSIRRHPQSALDNYYENNPPDGPKDRE